VWAEDSDEEGEQQPQSSRGRSRGQRSGFGAQGYTSGQAFVSAGVLQPAKDEKAEGTDEKQDDEMETDQIPVTDSSRYKTSNLKTVTYDDYDE